MSADDIQAQVQAEYEAEQARLNGEGDPDIQIDVPREVEVDPRVYKDSEALLFRGFIYAHLEINGVHFVLKSLNQHEFDNLQFVAGLHSDAQATKKFYNLFLAYGVLAPHSIS
jgi:hypothetical protein